MATRPAVTNRSLRWIGLGLLALAPLLGADLLAAWLGAPGLRDSAAGALGSSILQAAAFAAGVAVLRARRFGGAGPFPAATLAAGAGAYLALVPAVRAFESSAGVLEVLLAGAALGLLAIAAHAAAALLFDALGSPRRVPGVGRPLTAIVAATLAAALLEALLAGMARFPPAAAPATPPVVKRLAMPEALQRREVQVPGTRAAWYWQGHLHLEDARGLRRATPLPPKRPGVFRIAAFGDSLTYGQGVSAGQAWPAVLEDELRRTADVEVLNLGVRGAQSEDVLRLAQSLLPALEPDLVLYGVCLNDFLPSGRTQYRNNRAWSFTPPYGHHLAWGTRLGALAAAAYDQALLRLGVRADFYTDILRDFHGYRQRFARDVAALNRLALDRGLPPVAALVLTQVPASGDRGWRIGQLAEESLRAAGATVVPADYILANDGRDLRVGPWEAHPNVEAQRLFAEAFLTVVRGDPRLGVRRRGGSAPGRPAVSPAPGAPGAPGASSVPPAPGAPGASAAHVVP